MRKTILPCDTCPNKDCDHPCGEWERWKKMDNYTRENKKIRPPRGGLIE